MFTYREIVPHPLLVPYVKCFWILRSTSDAPRTERIIPDGSFEMVFHFGDPFAGQPRSMLVGEIRRPVLVQPSPRADVIGVRFHVGGAAAFLRMPLRELRDTILPLDDVLRFDVIEPQIAIIESQLIRRLTTPRHFTTVNAAIDVIRRSRSSYGVAATIGVTERTLERAFNDCVGMSPKTLSRLMRFHATLADPSLDAGYYDDSHLVHEFREFSGTTPREFRRERHAINDAFVGNLQDNEER